jgi:hypothetical protein
MFCNVGKHIVGTHHRATYQNYGNAIANDFVRLHVCISTLTDGAITQDLTRTGSTNI